ncbi:MAG: phosphoribosylformylglycinamidine synthase, partial [Bacillota bacterium]
AALSEMCWGGGLGVRLKVPAEHWWEFLFNETPACFVLELPAGVAAGELFDGLPWQVLGTTLAGSRIVLEGLPGGTLELELAELQRAYQAPMREVFGA